MRKLSAIDPEAFVEADRIDHEGVALPLADRVTVEARRERRRMLAVHVDRPVGVRAADVEDVGDLRLGQFQEFGTVRRQPLTRAPRRLAAGVRFELHPAAIVGHRARPRHVRNRRAWPGRATAEAAGSTSCCAAGTTALLRWALLCRTRVERWGSGG